ncbi:hypothetical protein StoSoilB13_43530 (plasmid) [Arthrobacter sp. StoSoilB13]|nr:hypothetical protein StoSoilB13_43530 [Arthrobacter sp. StoSoilB13]
MAPITEPADGFLTDYYEHVTDDDVRSYTPETLLERARYHRSLAERREPGQAVIGVLNETDTSLVAIVTDDMPYLLPSVTAEISRDTASIRLLVHPTFSVTRDPATHRLIDIRRGPHRAGLPTGVERSEDHARATPAPSTDGNDGGRLTEAWIAIEIPRIPDNASAELLVGRLNKVLGDVRAAAEDADAIHEELLHEIGALEGSAAKDRTAGEAQELLRWLDDGNFVFLGFRGRRGLGLLRDAAGPAAPGEVSGQVLTLTKSTLRSTVLRRAYLDEISIATADGNGTNTSACTFVGLFSPSSTARPAPADPGHPGHSAGSAAGLRLPGVVTSRQGAPCGVGGVSAGRTVPC